MRRVLLAIALAGGCSLDESGLGQGGTGADAAPDVHGSDVTIIPPNDAGTDAFIADADADVAPVACESVCTAPNATCKNGTCVFDCTGNSACLTKTTCPAGVPCEIDCGFLACGDIDCSKASACTIDCAGGGGSECTGNITCGGSTCSLHCGYNSCQKDVSCSAQQCNVTCDTTACRGNVSCGGSACSVACSDQACSGNLTCSASTTCNIACNGSPSCSGTIQSGAGTSTICCNGAGSCGGKVSCGQTKCEVGCMNAGTCVSGVTCTAKTCVLDASTCP
jgi:hypothetical protein